MTEEITVPEGLSEWGEERDGDGGREGGEVGVGEWVGLEEVCCGATLISFVFCFTVVAVCQKQYCRRLRSPVPSVK